MEAGVGDSGGGNWEHKDPEVERTSGTKRREGREREGQGLRYTGSRGDPGRFYASGIIYFFKLVTSSRRKQNYSSLKMRWFAVVVVGFFCLIAEGGPIHQWFHYAYSRSPHGSLWLLEL